jgi:uncharacterized membrane protein
LVNGNGARILKNDPSKDLKDYNERVNVLVNEFESRIHEQLDEEYLKSTKWSDKFADKIASFGGSWRFIILFFSILVLWIIINSLSITKIIHFDEAPFILLNLVLSFLAGFQAPIILMSQNRQASRDKKVTVIDYAINYKAEQEIDDMQGHLHRLESDFAEFRKDIKNELLEIKKLLRDR